MIRTLSLLSILILLAMLWSGCAKQVVVPAPPPSEISGEIPEEAPEAPLTASLEEVDIRQIDLADDLDDASLITAIDHSVAYYKGLGRDQVYWVGSRRIDAPLMLQTLAALRTIIGSSADAAQRKRRLADQFVLYRATGQTGEGDVIFTGYYEPLLEGSLTRTDIHKHPIYRTPPDLIAEKISPHQTRITRRADGRQVPYYTRREIDVEGVLQGRGLELAWVSCPVELLSLHIQGSGKIRLPNGEMISVGYAQNNGWPFRSVTTNMLAQNKIERADSSYRAFKTWLKGKSEPEMLDIISHNERYIFFRLIDHQPVGSLGRPVTPKRSIATDPACFPPGAPAFIRLRKPVLDSALNVIRRDNFSRFVMNQDKGSAIKGPGRVDLFFGFGPEAQAAAGSLKEKGELYFLLLK